MRLTSSSLMVPWSISSISSSVGWMTGGARSAGGDAWRGGGGLGGSGGRPAPMVLLAAGPMPPWAWPQGALAPRPPAERLQRYARAERRPLLAERQACREGGADLLSPFSRDTTSASLSIFRAERCIAAGSPAARVLERRRTSKSMRHSNPKGGALGALEALHACGLDVPALLSCCGSLSAPVSTSKMQPHWLPRETACDRAASDWRSDGMEREPVLLPSPALVGARRAWRSGGRLSRSKSAMPSSKSRTGISRDSMLHGQATLPAPQALPHL
mmetsp:Transcript_100269/g.323531  ORF Transcript_100269/g.323531 Transcript_100269/m.323531 type:complete len:273 (+) Transcript_100269:1540-2358(+)